MAEEKKKSAFGAFLISLLISVVLICVAWYFLIKNNVAGLGETMRPMIKDIPILNQALPAPPDPSDPSLFPRETLDEEYRKLLVEKNTLIGEREVLKTENDELNQIKSKYTILERELNALTTQPSESGEIKINEETPIIDEAAIKNYVKIYETMDPAEASKILENIGTLNIELVTKVCRNMKSNKLSAIMIEMDKDFAAVLGERLALEMNVI